MQLHSFDILFALDMGHTFFLQQVMSFTSPLDRRILIPLRKITCLGILEFGYSDKFLSFQEQLNLKIKYDKLWILLANVYKKQALQHPYKREAKLPLKPVEFSSSFGKFTFSSFC